MMDPGVRRFLCRTGASVALVLTAVEAQVEFVSRTFNGTGNNLDFPEWGSTGTTQIRQVAGADYADGAFTPPGGNRPTAREVMSDVFLSSTATASTKSALFVAWGQLLTYDMSLTIDNTSEPFNVACDDRVGVADVWCPLGADSEEIRFDRSSAAVSSSVRSPVNYATSYIDLDFMYGRSEDEANTFRKFEGGKMNVTDTGVPFHNADGTWMIPDQRTARFPVTFALHIMLLLEHNRCCVEVAPANGFEGDEEIYLACRGWTIAIFQHMTADDYTIRLFGGTIYVLGVDTSSSSATTTATTGLGPSSDNVDNASRHGRRRRLSNYKFEYDGGSFERQEERLQETDGDAAVDVQRPMTAWRTSLQRGLGGRGESGPISSDKVSRSGEVSRSGVGSAPAYGPRRKLYSPDVYDETVNAAADVFTLTAGAAAFESAIPPTVRIVSEGYAPVDEDNIELTVACEDMAGLFERNDVGDILRGAVLSPALEVGTYYSAAVSNLSPLFKLPVDAVQRGRDHGLPTYNDAREAFGLTAATDFSDITSNERLAELLSAAYGGDIETVDAITGGLAESGTASSGGVFGDLLHEAWVDQFFRAIAGDRLYHVHGRPMEAVDNTTLSDVINRTLNVNDLPLSVFVTPGVTVCASDCETEGEADVTLSDSFGVAWKILDDETLSISLRAKGIGDTGMLGIGWGGLLMSDAQDFVICEVKSATEGECIDRSPVSTHSEPAPDLVGPSLAVTNVSIEGEWTTITFIRDLASLDEQDYDLGEDIKHKAETLVIYSYREGAGVGQHPNSNRGASTVNFATGDAERTCDNDDDNFESLHGALMLIAWMVLAPAGIYYIRYRKGESVGWAGREWYVMHEEIMIVTAEAVLPLGITAVVATGGNHDTQHAQWGYYMIAAVAAQLITGWIRTKGLEAKHANFSLLHRCNKYFHIWAGRFAYLAGVVQCYRGLELVSGSDELLFSTVEGLDLELGSFRTIKHYVFPVWLGLMSVVVIFLESRKQYRRFFKKGTAHLCACVTVINEGHVHAEHGRKTERLMPRTEALEIYSVKEFNEKVLNGQSWVLVDGAILDVSKFSQGHPGGARLVLLAVGTDVTHELLGRELSVGHAMSFSPHAHEERAWDIVRSLVVGYIDEDDDDKQEQEKENAGEHKLRDDEELTQGLGEAAQQPVQGEKEGYFSFGKNRVARAGSKLSTGHDSLASTARRLSRIASISVTSTVPEDFGPLTRTGAVTRAPSVIQQNTTSPAVLKRAWSGHKLLERFHVCPLLFREKMEPCSRGDPGDNSPSKRPVYRYIFSCPGQAQALVEAITGVCYVNMRAQKAGKGVIQRSYNAFAVRVNDSQASTPGTGVKGGRAAGRAGTFKAVPARQTTEGILCIEMRIRLHHDGTMSKLLEKLANDTDNPAVQLQGPFVINKLAPPPAYRNVVMIAAGTGINPMVQQIRLYLALPRDVGQSTRSRLALVWQCASEAELYGTDEITEMQAMSNGLLEVTVLISGHHRKRNVPGEAFAKAKKNFMANARSLISPASSSTSNSVAALPARRKRDIKSNSNKETRDGLSPAMAHDGDLETEAAIGERFRAGWNVRRGSKQRLSGDDENSSPSTEAAAFGPQPKRPSFSLTRELRQPSRQALRRTGLGLTDSTRFMVSDPVGRRVPGKLTRDDLDKVFGPALLATLESYGKRPATTRSERNGDVDCDDEEHDAPSGVDVVAEKLQVVVSGPSGFVFNVEGILTEMGVPSSAIVLLD